MNYSGNDLYKNLVSGGLSGFTSLTATYPTEYVKTKMQMGSNKSFFNIFSHSLKNGGVSSMYKGYFPTLMSIIPRAAINYTIYEYTFYNLRQKGYTGHFANLFSGMVSGASAGFLLATTVENIKTHSIFYKDKNSWEIIKMIYKENGMKGFYRGFIPTIVKESTTYGMRFFIYTTTYKKLDEEKVPLVLNALGSSALAGFISSFLNNPIDVIQTRKQMPKIGLDSTFFGIIKNEGIKELYRGVFIRSIRTIPAAGISFLTYEILCKKLFTL